MEKWKRVDDIIILTADQEMVEYVKSWKEKKNFLEPDLIYLDGHVCNESEDEHNEVPECTLFNDAPSIDEFEEDESEYIEDDSIEIKGMMMVFIQMMIYQIWWKWNF